MQQLVTDQRAEAAQLSALAAPIELNEIRNPHLGPLAQGMSWTRHDRQRIINERLQHDVLPVYYDVELSDHQIKRAFRE